MQLILLGKANCAVREEFGATARQVLLDRAAFIRKRLPDFVLRLPVMQIELGSMARLPGDYVSGHALGATYNPDALPDERALDGDLRSALEAYSALTFRGAWIRNPRQRSAGSSSNRNRSRKYASIDCTIGSNASTRRKGREATLWQPLSSL
jgi:hypothetical protein